MSIKKKNRIGAPQQRKNIQQDSTVVNKKHACMNTQEATAFTEPSWTLTLAAGSRCHVELAAENTCATRRMEDDDGSELERIIFLTGGSMVARKSGEGIMLNDAEDSVVLINVEHTVLA